MIEFLANIGWPLAITLCVLPVAFLGMVALFIAVATGVLD